MILPIDKIRVLPRSVPVIWVATICLFPSTSLADAQYNIVGTWYREGSGLGSYMQKQVFKKNGTGKYYYNKEEDSYDFTYSQTANVIKVVRDGVDGKTSGDGASEITLSESKLIQTDNVNTRTYWAKYPSDEYLEVKSRHYMCGIGEIELIDNNIKLFIVVKEIVTVMHADKSGSQISVGYGAPQSDAGRTGPNWITMSVGDVFIRQGGMPEDVCSVRVVMKDNLIGIHAHWSFHPPVISIEDDHFYSAE